MLRDSLMQAVYQAGLIHEKEVWVFQDGKLIKTSSNISPEAARLLQSELEDETHTFQSLQKDEDTNGR